jgi:hypothetical protein
MADKTDPSVKITLDKERTLYLDLAGMRAYQKVRGKNPLVEKGINLNDPDDLSAILWACLIREDKDLKLEAVEQMVDISNIRYIQVQMVQALFASFPETDKEKVGSEPPLAVENLPTG